jgi:hypothetical protein
MCVGGASLSGTKNETAQEVRMTSPDPSTIIAAHGLEPTYSAREAAALLAHSYSWLDQGLRNNKFALLDGTVVRPLRTPGGYRRFTLAMVKDIATCSYRHGWLSFDELKSTFLELARAAYDDTGPYKIPG